MITIVVDSTKISAQLCNIDKCIDITQTIGPTKTDPNCGAFQSFTAQGCMIDATPETGLTHCGANQYPTVWFKVVVDDSAVQLVSAVNASGSWYPTWAIYSGPCDSLSLVFAGLNSDIPCSDSDQNKNIHSVGVLQNISTYYIAVSGQGIIDNPNFTLTVWTTANCVTCIGEAGCNPEATWTVQSRSSNRPLDDPKFCPGEQVTICVNFLYDASQTGVDWFHGLIPDFGPGWDMSSFDPEAVSINPAGAVWHDEKNPSCAPSVTEQMPYLCTYIDPETGVLKLCHTGCQACPCSGPLLADSPLPGGWFWSTPGGPGCSNDCSPATKYGFGALVTNINFCVDLKVKEFDNSLDCIEQRSLHFNFQTTSDGVTGCWNDPIAECKLDFAQIGPYWEIDCSTGPAIIGNNDEICGQGITQIELTNADGDTSVLIEVQVLPNPNVSGENNHYFDGGEGTIADTLINNSDSIQIITYIALSKIPGILCSSGPDTFRVMVYPAVNVAFDPVVLCSDTTGSVILNPIVTGGTGNYIGTTSPFSPGYIWSTSETSHNIEVPTTISANYTVTVCDDKGCCASNDISITPTNENIVGANIFYTTPSCDISTVDISIDDSKIDTLTGLVFRLLDCEGNVVMNDSLPYVIEGVAGIFENVKYTENNCFILETAREGCTARSDTLRIECVNAVEDQLTDLVTIIPNPTSGIITLKNIGTKIISAVKIFNSLGVEIFVQHDFLHQVDISFVPEGVYILSIEFDDGKKSGFRIIKIR